MENSEEYKKAAGEMLKSIREKEKKEGTQSAIVMASRMMRQLGENEDFRYSKSMHGQYDACEQFLIDNEALAL